MSINLSLETKRRSRRAQVYLSGELVVGCETVKVTIRDISTQGALIVSDHPLVENCQVELKRGALNAQGCLIWVQGRQAGVKFDRPVPAHVLEKGIPKALAKMLEAHRPGS